MMERYSSPCLSAILIVLVLFACGAAYAQDANSSVSPSETTLSATTEISPVVTTTGPTANITETTSAVPVENTTVPVTDVTTAVSGTPSPMATGGGGQNITPYNGMIDPDNPLYGVKLGWENLEEALTFNQSDRLNLQLAHADLRLSEALREANLNRSESAQHVLDLYEEKMNSTGDTLAGLDQNSTGLLHAQTEIAKHQVVLGELLMAQPNNTGLERAYNNSILLNARFAEKIQRRSMPMIPAGQMPENASVTGEPGAIRHGEIDKSQSQENNRARNVRVTQGQNATINAGNVSSTHGNAVKENPGNSDNGKTNSGNDRSANSGKGRS